MSNRDLRKSIVTQACLMLAIEHKVNDILSECCVACKEVNTSSANFTDHECINPTWFKAFVYGICSEVSQLESLRDKCYHFFQKYCIAYDHELDTDIHIGPFDGHFQLIIHNSVLVDTLKDIVGSHKTSTTEEIVSVLSVYYTITNDLMTNVDLSSIQSSQNGEDDINVSDFDVDFTALLMSFDKK